MTRSHDTLTGDNRTGARRGSCARGLERVAQPPNPSPRTANPPCASIVRRSTTASVVRHVTLRRMRKVILLLVTFGVASLAAQSRPAIDWAKVDVEAMQHFQALLRFDTTDPPTTPPGVEKPAVD